MQCGQFESRLNELLDERLSPEVDPAVQWHARQCPQCAALLASHEALLFAVEGLELEPAGIDLSGRVAAEVSRGRTLVFRPSAWWMGAAAAAALLVGVAAWHWVGPGRSNALPGAGGGNPTLLGQTDPHGNSADPAAARSAPFVTVWLTRDAERLTEDFSVRPRLMMEQMADGLKPVTESMSAALHALQRSWSSSEPAARSS